MFGFWKKKKEPEKIQQQAERQEQEPRYTCLFCKKTFKASEIVFANTLLRPDPQYYDAAFDRAVKQYQQMTARDKDGKMHGLTAVSRKFLDRDRWKVIKYESNGLPLMVQGPFEKTVKDERVAGDDLSFDEGNADFDGGRVDDEDLIVNSSERLCPHCHFTLPEGFATDRVIQVGLLGGSRTGKTTYMAVVTQYLLNKMGLLNSGLELARVELLPECLKYQEALYLSQRVAEGAKATSVVGDVLDQMVMPIIMRFTPIHPDYKGKPFFLILQDIPGEYLQPEKEKFLLNSNIPKSDELVLLVDINHFIDTIQQVKDSVFGAACSWDVNELYANLDSLGRLIPEGKLHSVQCTLTKLDFWLSEEKDRLAGAVFSNNCDDYHRNAIDDERLGLVHEQISALLHGIGGKDQSGLLDNLINSLGVREDQVHRSYTAVASRIVPNHESQLLENGADYQSSLNVLEPLMNIFEWEGLLPVKNRPSEQ